jgi:hypothetical protein
MAGMGQGQGQVTIVRDNQEPLAVPVKTSNREEARCDMGDQIEKSTTPMSIVGGAEDIAWLVEQEIKLSLNTHASAIYRDTIELRIDARPLLGHDSPVHCHPTVGNQHLARASRTQTACGEMLLQADITRRAWFWGARLHGLHLSISRV